MITRIIIARHGNTFTEREIPTRVGAGTDLPLVEEHRGMSIGKYLLQQDWIPDAVYAAPLRRTLQTALLAIKAFGGTMQPIIEEHFTEIDYGPDENKTENEVMLRLGHGDREKGSQIIEAWNSNATVPEGWKVNPTKIINTWRAFAKHVETCHSNRTILLVSSNGILRFAPHLTGDFAHFATRHSIKVSTGGICIFEKTAAASFWTCTAWNKKPYHHF